MSTDRRERARRRCIGFSFATLGAFVVKVALILAIGHDTTLTLWPIVFFAVLATHERAWIWGFDAGRRESSDGN